MVWQYTKRKGKTFRMEPGDRTKEQQDHADLVIQQVKDGTYDLDKKFDMFIDQVFDGGEE